MMLLMFEHVSTIGIVYMCKKLHGTLQQVNPNKICVSLGILCKVVAVESRYI